MLLGQYTHNLLGNSSGLIWSTFNIAGILNCHLNLTPIYVVGKERIDVRKMKNTFLVIH